MTIPLPTLVDPEDDCLDVFVLTLALPVVEPADMNDASETGFVASLSVAEFDFTSELEVTDTEFAREVPLPEDVEYVCEDVAVPVLTLWETSVEVASLEETESDWVRFALEFVLALVVAEGVDVTRPVATLSVFCVGAEEPAIAEAAVDAVPPVDREETECTEEVFMIVAVLLLALPVAEDFKVVGIAKTVSVVDWLVETLEFSSEVTDVEEPVREDPSNLEDV